MNAADIHPCKFCGNNYIGNRCHCLETNDTPHKCAAPDAPQPKTYGRCAVCGDWIYRHQSTHKRNDGRYEHDYCIGKSADNRADKKEG